MRCHVKRESATESGDIAVLPVLVGAPFSFITNTPSPRICVALCAPVVGQLFHPRQCVSETSKKKEASRRRCRRRRSSKDLPLREKRLTRAAAVGPPQKRVEFMEPDIIRSVAMVSRDGTERHENEVARGGWGWRLREKESCCLLCLPLVLLFSFRLPG